MNLCAFGSPSTGYLAKFWKLPQFIPEFDTTSRNTAGSAPTFLTMAKHSDQIAA